MDNNIGKTAEKLRYEIRVLVEEFYRVTEQTNSHSHDQIVVPVSGKVIDGEDIAAVVDSALDGWFTTGRFNEKFQDKLTDFIGCRLSRTCNSGSSANLLALSALTSPKLQGKALQPGDEIITCATGFPTTVNPIFQNNLVPVFVDAELPSYNINISRIEEAITSKTRGIMIAHALGNPFDAVKIKSLCDEHDLYLIEDCCDALGATIDGQHVGTFGDMGTLSFYPAHHITMGEGGAVFTRKFKYRRLIETFRDWGRDCWCEGGVDNTCGNRFGQQLGELPFGYDHKYTYSHLGYNLKITDMQAALGLSQLNKIDKFVEARRRNFQVIFDSLKELEDQIILPESLPNADPSWFGFPITLRETDFERRNKIVRQLNEMFIGTRLLFGGNLTKQPYLIGRDYRVFGDLSVSDNIMSNTFWVGVYPGLGMKQIDYLCHHIKDALRS